MVKWSRVVRRYRTSYVIAWAFVLPVVMLLFDNYPPRFPLDPSEKAVDCYNVQLRDISLRSGRLHLEFETDEFIQYPRQVAPHLVSIETNVDNNRLRFTSEGFTCFNSTLSAFEFDLYQPIHGTVNVTAICQQRELGSTLIEVTNNATFLTGWSRMNPCESCLVEFCDFCLDNGNITFSSLSAGQINAFNISGSTQLNVHLDRRSMSMVQFSTPGTTLEQGSSILVEDNSKTIAEYFTDVVLPVFLAQNETSRVFLAGDSPFTGLQSVADTIVPFAIRERSCFQSLRFVRTSSSTSPFAQTQSFFDYLLEQVRPRLHELRAIFHPFTEPPSPTILSDSCSTTACTDITTIHDVAAIASLLSSAPELLVTTPAAIPLALFLPPTATLSTTNPDLLPEIAKFANLVNCTHRFHRFPFNFDG